MVERNLDVNQKEKCAERVAEIKARLTEIDSSITAHNQQISLLNEIRRDYVDQLRLAEEEHLCLRLGIPVETAINSRISSNQEIDSD
jgi:hypothetical protein